MEVDMSTLNAMQSAAKEREAGPQLWLWEKSFELAVAVFKVADRIPQSLGLTLNGQLSLALGSLSELERQLSLCCELGYASDLEERQLQMRIKELKRSATRLLRRVRGLLSGNRLQAISEEIAALVSEENSPPAGGR
jgi:hypothetical protein